VGFAFHILVHLGQKVLVIEANDVDVVIGTLTGGVVNLSEYFVLFMVAEMNIARYVGILDILEPDWVPLDP
jgi:hypothetical protein